MRKIPLAVASLIIALLIVPTVACATTHTTRVLSVKTGPQIASEALSQLGGISISASGVTVKVGPEGHRRAIRIDLGDLAPTSQGSSGGLGLLGLAFLAPVAGAFLRLLTFLARLGAR